MPQYSGNPLIEALPEALEPAEALAAFSTAPAYSPEQCQWKISERVQMLKTLSGFMVPLERHIALASELDSMLRNGYVGRAPATPEYAERRQAIYAERMNGADFAEDQYFTPGHQLSLLLMGLSGMGKTRFLKRWAAQYPSVIYHQETHVYQIPVLHIELPANGESVTGLCNAIFRAIDKLIPGSNYVEQYAIRGRPTVEMLILRVETVLHLHCVGMLICDEVQNLTNAGKSKQRLMTELVSMSNILSLPLIFIGTNKTEMLFGLDFRQTRRVSGFGGQHWDRLEEGCVLDDGRVLSEWRDFAEYLWQFQWTRKPTPLTEELLSTLYWCCQGVIDTCIKMFAATQARAILYGSEEITKELLLDVYKADFQLMHPMLEALRKNDLNALARFADIKPPALSVIVDSVQRRAQSLKTSALTVTKGTPGFVNLVASAVHATGFPLEDSMKAAHEVVSEGKAKNLVAATAAAVQTLTPHASPKRAGGSGRKKVAIQEQDFSDRPDDLRRYLQYSERSGQNVLGVLEKAGVVRPIQELLAI
jgi:hypothetical protein